jgi:hypothetical protein
MRLWPGIFANDSRRASDRVSSTETGRLPNEVMHLSPAFAGRR